VAAAKKFKGLKKKRSKLHGYGLFADQHFEKGQLVINWLKTSDIIPEKQYKQEGQTAVRLFGELYIDGKRDDTDFINHSNKPNCVYLIGLVFAKRDIKGGEELTLNYSHFIPGYDFNVVSGTHAYDEMRRVLRYVCKNWRSFHV
jgi:SET domain